MPRLDVAGTLDRLAEVTGVRLVPDGPAPGGEVGAAYVRWPDGHRSVLTQAQADVGDLVDVARAAGLPVPRHELTAGLGDGSGGYAVVQELLPGVPPGTVDASLVDAMVALNQRCAGLLADRTGYRPVPLYLTRSGPGFCWHETLAGYGRRTARILDWVHEVGAERDTADGSDLMHVDFHVGNVLVSDGVITGIVDWDGAGRGDRTFDLVTLWFDLAMRAPALGDRLDGLLTDTVNADRLRAYRAHMSLRLVDWAIRHHGPADVELWCQLAERYVD